MKDRALKLMPFVVGGLLGWLLVHPPAVLSALGAGRYLVTGALVLLALLLFTAAQISANLPDEVSLEPVGEATVSRGLAGVRDAIVALGFAPVGPPLKVGIAPPAVMIGLVHPSEPIYAAAYQTGTLPARVAFDFVSVLEGDRGGLTSNAERAGAALPASPGSLKQVFQGVPPARVLEGHRRGLAHLAARGLRPRPVSAAAFARDFKASLRRQRRAFLSAPVRRTALMLWRAATGATPHLGPIEAQPGAQREIERILAGRTASAA